jgi:hypothetical protein
MLECKGCKYWVSDSTSTGLCHRWPRPVKASGGHWCGEHKARAIRQPRRTIIEAILEAEER